MPPALRKSMVPRLFIQRVDIGALVVRATMQGFIPGKQVSALQSIGVNTLGIFPAYTNEEFLATEG